MSFRNAWFAGSVCSRSGPSSTVKPLRYTVMVRFCPSAGGGGGIAPPPLRAVRREGTEGGVRGCGGVVRTFPDDEEQPDTGERVRRGGRSTHPICACAWPKMPSTAFFFASFGSITESPLRARHTSQRRVSQCQSILKKAFLLCRRWWIRVPAAAALRSSAHVKVLAVLLLVVVRGSVFVLLNRAQAVDIRHDRSARLFSRRVGTRVTASERVTQKTSHRSMMTLYLGPGCQTDPTALHNGQPANIYQ